MSKIIRSDAIELHTADHPNVRQQHGPSATMRFALSDGRTLVLHVGDGTMQGLGRAVADYEARKAAGPVVIQ